MDAAKLEKNKFTDGTMLKPFHYLDLTKKRFAGVLRKLFRNHGCSWNPTRYMLGGMSQETGQSKQMGKTDGALCHWRALKKSAENVMSVQSVLNPVKKNLVGSNVFKIFLAKIVQIVTMMMI